MEQCIALGSKFFTGLKKDLGRPKKMLHKIELADEVWTDVFLFLSRSNIQKSVVSTDQHFRYIIHRYLPTYPYFCIYKLFLFYQVVRLYLSNRCMNYRMEEMTYKEFWKTFGRNTPPSYLRILAIELCTPPVNVRHQRYINRIMSAEWLRKWQNSFTTSNLQRLENYGQPTIYTSSQHYEAWSSSFYMAQGEKYDYLLPALLNDIALTAHIAIGISDNATMLSLLGGRTIMEMPAIQQCRCLSIASDRHDALLSIGTAEQIIDWLYSEQQSRPRLVGDHPNVTKVMSLLLSHAKSVTDFATLLETKIVQDFIDAHTPVYFDLDIDAWLYGISGSGANVQTNAITKETLQIWKSRYYIKIKRRASSMFWAYNHSAGKKLMVKNQQH
ncbi:hypothetical protein Ddc_12565 [Ditylenchus destructor]|nr:hypothetical protein Ddc_12565 [Ditylenchus destructor]